MRVFEILRDDVEAVSEAVLTEKLASFDWKYEYADDLNRQTRGLRQLALLENMVYQFWKQEPDKAIALWNKFSGADKHAGFDAQTMPSFILRLQSQEK
jgi:hypothetical protein